MSESLPEFKVILLGEANVGKSSILMRYINSSFESLNNPTVGVSFFSKIVQVSDRTVRLNIWDTAGQERYSALTKVYSRDSQAAILVYDITCKSSFEKMKYWHQVISQEKCENSVVYAIVGNKEDLAPELERVEVSEVRNFARAIGAECFRVSAKLNLRIDDLFSHVVQKATENRRVSQSVSFSLSRSEAARKKKCC